MCLQKPKDDPCTCSDDEIATSKPYEFLLLIALVHLQSWVETGAKIQKRDKAGVIKSLYREPGRIPVNIKNAINSYSGIYQESEDGSEDTDAPNHPGDHNHQQEHENRQQRRSHNASSSLASLTESTSGDQHGRDDPQGQVMNIEVFKAFRDEMRAEMLGVKRGVRSVEFGLAGVEKDLYSDEVDGHPDFKRLKTDDGWRAMSAGSQSSEIPCALHNNRQQCRMRHCHFAHICLICLSPLHIMDECPRRPNADPQGENQVAQGQDHTGHGQGEGFDIEEDDHRSHAERSDNAEDEIFEEEALHKEGGAINNGENHAGGDDGHWHFMLA